MKFVLLLIRGPFWVQLVLAAGLVWLGFWMQGELAKTAEARAALLAQEPPATVPITEAMGAAGASTQPVEVSVSAELALGENTRLVKKTNGITTGETLMYVLFAPGAPEGTKLAQAAILIDPDDLDAFIDWAGTQTTGFGVHGPVATITGLKVSPSEGMHASKAMTENGLTRAEGFFYIEPFIRGREAGLTATPPGNEILYVFFGLAALFALIGGKRFLTRRKLVSAPVEEPAVAPVLAVPPAAATDVAADFGTTPIAALRAGAAAAAPVPAAPVPAAEVTAAEVTAAAEAKRGLPKLTYGRIALVVFAVLVAAAAMGRWEVFGLLPVAILGAICFVVFKGKRALGRVASGLIDRKPGLDKADDPLPAKVAVPAPAPALAARARDGFADGPIKSAAGFSFRSLIPQPKAKAMAGPDPFDRLTAMVAAERRRERMARLGPAE